MELYKLDNVEIFRTGKWHDVPFTEKNLDEMVDNFNRFYGTWFKPALVGGHPPEDDRTGKTALGYVHKLWRVGKKLLANFGDMPKSVYSAIKSHGYDRVSVELWPEQERGGKVYKNVLKAIALLGIEIPEVDGLRPLRESFSTESKTVDLTTFLSVDGEAFVKWTDAYINDLPDGAFAAYDPSTSGKGKSSKTRFLPHHTSAFRSDPDADDHSTVDIPHLVNAFYKLDKIDGVSDSERIVMRSHLEQHAKALGVEIPTKQEVKMTDKEKAAIEAKEKEQADKILALSADLTKAMEEIKKLTADDGKDSTKEIETLKAKVEADGKEILELQAANRKNRIDAKVKELRVPALVPFVREFYEMASGKTDVIKFSADGKDAKDTTPEQVVDQLVGYINKVSESLFSSTGIVESFERDDVEPDENIRVDVDNKVRAYMAEKKEEDYTVAQAAIFAADPKLKEAYAAS